MPRRSPEMIRAHRRADRHERRMAARFLRATDQLRERVSIYELALAISNRDLKAALRLLPDEDVRDAFEPLADSAQEAFESGGKGMVEELKRGGKLAAEEVNRT
jgi:hypothetical protein